MREDTQSVRHSFGIGVCFNMRTNGCEATEERNPFFYSEHVVLVTCDECDGNLIGYRDMYL